MPQKSITDSCTHQTTTDCYAVHTVQAICFLVSTHIYPIHRNLKQYLAKLQEYTCANTLYNWRTSRNQFLLKKIRQNIFQYRQTCVPLHCH